MERHDLGGELALDRLLAQPRLQGEQRQRRDGEHRDGRVPRAVTERPDRLRDDEGADH